ncbi:MAG: hypothetical protein ACWA45_10230 [Flavobacteriales bacterium]
MVLPISNISHLIPQKFPFKMVSTLEHFLEKEVVSTFTITKENLFAKNNYFTEPGLIENMAQTVALHTGYDYFLKGKDAPTGYIGSIKNVKIQRLPAVNEIITTKAIILVEMMGVTLVDVVVFDSNKTILASSQMKTVIANS